MNLKYYLRGLGIGILVTAIIMLVISHQSNAPMTDEEVKERAASLGMIEAGTTLDELAKNTNEEVDEANIDSNEEAMTEDENTGDGEDPAVEAPLESKEPATIASEEPTVTPTKEPLPSEEPINPDINAEVDDHLDNIESKLDEADDYINKKNGTKTPEPTKTPEATPTPTATPNKNTDSGAATTKSITLVISKGESSYTVAKHLAELGAVEDANSFDTYLCSTGVDRKIRTGTFTIPEGSTKADIASIIGG